MPAVHREPHHQQPKLAEQINTRQNANTEPLQTGWYEYHVKVIVRVENLTSALPAGYFRTVNGVT